MANNLKSLAGETVIYGLSTMLGRLLNFLLVPLYVRTISQAEYGVFGTIYSFSAVFLVIFTYGLETGFFRFATEKEPKNVYKTSLIMLTFTSSFLVLLTILFAPSLSTLLFQGKFIYAIYLMGMTIALDAFLSIPFAYLRLRNRPIKFGIFKFIAIAINIGLNLFFLVLLPYLIDKQIVSVRITEIFNSYDKVFYIFLSGFLASFFSIFLFVKEIFTGKGKFEKGLVVSLLSYSWPILVVGLTGMIIQNSDKMLMIKLLPYSYEKATAMTGIYTANFKIAVLMNLFTQSFRFAFEPYFFKNKTKGIDSYAKVMEYFVFFCLSIFIVITSFTDLVNVVITQQYADGNVIIPFVLIGLMFFGIYYNLSLWYKLTDKTYWGSLFGVVGMTVCLILNFTLIPRIGIMGGCIALCSAYFVMMIMSYLIGQTFYRVPYNLKLIAILFVSACLIYFINNFEFFETKLLSYSLKIITFVSFIVIFYFTQKLNFTKNGKYQSDKQE